MRIGTKAIPYGSVNVDHAKMRRSLEIRTLSAGELFEKEQRVIEEAEKALIESNDSATVDTSLLQKASQRIQKGR